MKLTDKQVEVSRRSFLVGMAALGAAAAVTGCDKNDDDNTYGGPLPGSTDPEDLSDLSSFDRYWAACPHNCGASGRCVNTVWVKNGRVKRLTSDDFETDSDGKPYDKDAINDPRRLSCAKGRAYKYRAYHNGRLKYPMKQTKKRGDLTGFVRITWEEAYDEVLRKYWAIYSKYGSGAIQHNNGPAGYAGTGVSAANPVSVITAGGGTRASYSDHSFHQYNYGRAMAGVPNSDTYADLNMGKQLQAVALGRIKHWVSFGTNSMTTNNSMSYNYLRANQMAKANDKNFKHYVISPELTDTGVLCATDWVQIRNQTDPALIAGMIYHMLDGTFNADGSVKANPLLDLDYIDTVLYGFFNSPEYWVNTTGVGGRKGEIELDDPQDTVNWRRISEVPEGRSYADWIMGSDGRLANAYYGDTNYTARRYTKDGQIQRARGGLCSLLVKGNPASDTNVYNTDYYTKKDYMTPKNPEWAEKITGIPADTIRELAEVYARADKDGYRILTEWTGGLQKSENGVITLFAIQTLFALTKNWGWNYGSTGSMFQTWATHLENLKMGEADPLPAKLPDMPTVNTSGLFEPVDGNTSTALSSNHVPAMSITEHHQGLYFAFKDVLDGENFLGLANPEWDGNSRYMFQAAAAKAQVLYARENDGVTYRPRTIELSDGTTRTYYDWITDNNQPVYAGKRFYLGPAGTLMNGVANTNWAAEIMSKLPLASKNPDDSETFCFAVFDFHLSTQAMFADYVFPMANSLEGYDNTSFGATSYSGGSSAPIRSFVRPAIITPPGEAKDTWDATYIGWKQRVETLKTSASFNRIDGGAPLRFTNEADAALKVIREDSASGGNGAYISHTEKYKKMIQEAIDAASPGHPFYGLTVEEAIGLQIRRVKQDPAPQPQDLDPDTKTPLRKNLDDYLSGNWAEANLETDPFITFERDVRMFEPYVNNALLGFTEESKAEIPASSTRGGEPGVISGDRQGYLYAVLGRMTCFAEYAVKGWERGHDIYHGWLPEEERGGRKVDYEGDPFIYPIPMYYDFRDAFNEMYGMFNPNPDRRNFNAGWKLIGSKPPTNDVSLITDRLTVTVGSTHDRYRSHSSTAENPLTRELNCRTKGGGWASGNDWNEYGVIPETDATPKNQQNILTPMRSKAIQRKDMKTASWHEFWLNDEDAAQFGIADGDLIRISNPVGAIRCTARVTARIVRGHGQIHHGAWYDPNPVDGVDDGACANTLMSNRPSKLDYGNAVHCAYCVVEKETSF